MRLSAVRSTRVTDRQVPSSALPPTRLLWGWLRPQAGDQERPVHRTDRRLEGSWPARWNEYHGAMEGCWPACAPVWPDNRADPAVSGRRGSTGTHQGRGRCVPQIEPHPVVELISSWARSSGTPKMTPSYPLWSANSASTVNPTTSL